MASVQLQGWLVSPLDGHCHKSTASHMQLPQGGANSKRPKTSASLCDVPHETERLRCKSGRSKGLDLRTRGSPS